MLDILRTLHIDNPLLFSEFSKPHSAPEAPQNRTQHAQLDEPPFPPDVNKPSDISFNTALTHTLTGEVAEGLMLQPSTQALQPQLTLADELDNDFPEEHANDTGEHCSVVEDGMGTLDNHYVGL
jgi:hypothetical protein